MANITRIKTNQISDGNVTAAKIASGTLVGSLFATDLSLNSNLTIIGNLSVSGNTSTINSVNTYIQDPLVVFNDGYTGSMAGYDVGIVVNRNFSTLAGYGAVNTAWVWDENDQAFESLATTSTGNAITSLTKTGFANLKVGNIVSASISSSGTISAVNFSGPVTGTTGSFSTLVATNFSTANAQITGGSVTGLTSAQATNLTGTTLVTTNFSTANVRITGGYLQSIANLRATELFGTNLSTANALITSSKTTTGVVTNFSTANALVTGGAVTELNNLFSAVGQVTTFSAPSLNSTNGNITTLVATNFSSGNAVIYGGYIGLVSNVQSPTAGFGTTTTVALNATSGNVTNLGSTTGVITNFSSSNVVVTGGYAQGLANVRATELFGTNTSTGNLVATSGSVGTLVATTGLSTANAIITNSVTTTGVVTNFSTGNAVITNSVTTTGVVTNFSTGNAVISGGYISSVANVQSPTAGFGTTTTVVLNATTGNITNLGTSNLVATSADVNFGVVDNFSSSNIRVSGGYAQGLANVRATELFGTNTSTSNLIATSGSVGTLVATTGLSTANAIITNSVTTTGVVTNLSSGNARISGGYADNFAIGANVRATGAFNSVIGTSVTVDGTTQSTGSATGALTVAGGVGIAKNLYVGGDIHSSGNIYAANIITSGTQTLSVTAGLVYLESSYVYPYDYDIGMYGHFKGGPANVYSHTGGVRNHLDGYWTFFSNVKTEPASGVINFADAGIIYDTIKTGDLILANTTTSTSTTSGALRVAGGAGIAGNLSLGAGVYASGSLGSNGQYLQTTGSGVQWSTVVVSGIYNGTSDVAINSSGGIVQVDVAGANAAAFSATGLQVNGTLGVTGSSTFNGISAASGSITGLSATTGVVTNFSTSNAQITSSRTTTGVVTNFSTANAVISGGYISSVANVQSPTAGFGTTTTVALNATTGNIASLDTTNFDSTTGVITNFSTSNLNATSGFVTTGVATNFSTANAVVAGGSVNGLTTLSATTGTVTNFSSSNVYVSGGYISTLTNVQAVIAGFGTATTVALNTTAGNVTNLGTSNLVATAGSVGTLVATIGLSTANAIITNQSTTTGVVTNFSSGNARIAGGYADNFAIGATTASTGRFTTLNVTTGPSNITGNVVIASGSDTNSTTTGALVITGTGGLNVGGNAYVGTNLYVGAGAFATNLTNPTIVAVDNGTTYAQAAIKNATNTGSSDWVAYANNSTNDRGWADMGFTGDAFNDPAYSITKSNDGYLFASGANTSVGGNLVLATDYAGGYNDIVVGVGSFYANSEVARFHGNTSNNGTFVLKLPTNGSPAANTGAFQVWGGASFSGNVYVNNAVMINGSKSSGRDFIVKGVNDNSLIWARPNATYDTVIVGNSATAGSVVNGAKLNVNTTDSILLPTGSTGQRPGSVGYTDVAGMLRYSTTLNAIEWYNGTSWQNPGAVYSVITDTQYNGDGIQTVFTLPSASTTAGALVNINGVVQIPVLAYSVSGTTLTFTEAPANGDVIDIRLFTAAVSMTSLSDTYGYNTVEANDDGIYITTGLASAVDTVHWNSDGVQVNTIANVTVASAATPTVVDTLNNNLYRTGKYVVQATNGTNYQAMEALVITNGSVATINVYSTVQTGGNLGVLSATQSGTNVLLNFTAVNPNTIVRMKKDYIPK